jgi:hypothetical protein
MKSKVTTLLSIGIALAAAAAVQAQDNIMTANVPFSFYMGSSLMPKGAYRVHKLDVLLFGGSSEASLVLTEDLVPNIQLLLQFRAQLTRSQWSPPSSEG